MNANMMNPSSPLSVLNPFSIYSNTGSSSTVEVSLVIVAVIVIIALVILIIGCWIISRQ